LVRGGTVGAHTNYFVTLVLQFAVIVAQTTGLSRTAGCTIFWVKVQYNFFSGKI
jgi:hypothetical protein